MTTMRRRPVHFSEATQVRCGELDEDWRTEGACRQGHDPEIWYPVTPGESWLGVAICNTCPVTQRCLEYAMAHRERNGTWGGLTEWQRHRHRRSRP